MRRLVCLISLTSLISAEEIKKLCKNEASCPSHFAYTSLISAEEIKNKCENKVSWVSCPSYFAHMLNISRRNKKIM